MAASYTCVSIVSCHDGGEAVPAMLVVCSLCANLFKVCISTCGSHVAVSDYHPQQRPRQNSDGFGP